MFRPQTTGPTLHPFKHKFDFGLGERFLAADDPDGKIQHELKRLEATIEELPGLL
ncbi:hypothetical protein FRC11_001861, partial [Ceratobasidium sp. 423]